MEVIAHIVMAVWVPVIFVIFGLFPARRAVILSFVIGWLFLPLVSYKIQGLPAYGKASATGIGVLLAIICFDSARLMAWRPRFIDLPMLVWCLCPIASSLNNDLGFYDGISAAFEQVVFWGIPYFIGRLYFREAEDFRELARALVVAGLVYAPLCMFEMRMSAQLSRYVYGSGGYARYHSWAGPLGWQPAVFLQTALACSIFMAGSALLAVWLWSSGAIKSVFGVPMGPLAALLVVVSIFCKGVGANTLLMGCLAALFAVRKLGTMSLVYVLVGVAPTYVLLRSTGLWSGRNLISTSTKVVTERKTQSLETRIENEDILMERAFQRPVFGWGRWGRSRVVNEEGKDICLTDGMWIIALGQTGAVGLTALLATLIGPVLVLAARRRAGAWSRPELAPMLGLAVLLTLYSIDNLFNAMLNPVFAMAIGAVSGARLLRGSAVNVAISASLPRGSIPVGT